MPDIRTLLKRLSFACLGLMAVILMAASVAEKFYGTFFVVNNIYTSPAVVALWVLLAALALAYMLVCRLHRNGVLFALHLSLLVVLSGALLTHVYGIRGRVHLRLDAPPTTVLTLDDGNIHRLPFRLSLSGFCVLRHEGSNLPMDFVSDIAINDDDDVSHGVVAMNRVYLHRGWRFCQMHYDDDERGTTLLVAYDPWGTGVTYCGCLLLFVLFAVCLLRGGGAASQFLKRPLARGMAFVLLFLLLLSSCLAVDALLPAGGVESRAFLKTVHGLMCRVWPLAVVCLTLGGIALVAVCWGANGASLFLSRLRMAVQAVSVAVVIYLLLLLFLRGCIGGYIPLSNGYEVMLFMALCSVSFAFWGWRDFSLAWPFGLLVAGFALVVAGMGDASDITPLSPVLHSPILSVHVSVIMCAYALFAFIMLNGVVAIALHYIGGHEQQIAHMAFVSRTLLHPALFLLVTGVIVGAVWADISWGRYWGWDPKEVWALITVIVYSFPIHAVSLQRFRSPMFLHIFFVLSFLCVLFTYFGVNYILGGLHSYAG